MNARSGSIQDTPANVLSERLRGYGGYVRLEIHDGRYAVVVPVWVANVGKTSWVTLAYLPLNGTEEVRDHQDRSPSVQADALLAYPVLDERYAAAAADRLHTELTPSELTPRVTVSLDNAFAAGVIWQYNRDRAAVLRSLAGATP